MLTVDPVIGTALSGLDPIGATQATGPSAINRRIRKTTVNLSQRPNKPLLYVDVDGVISLFGFPSDRCPPGSWLSVDGVPHLISATAGAHLLDLSGAFELVWCTGWEEKADEHLPHLLRLPVRPPFLTFEVAPSAEHWKLGSLDRHAGDRPVAWIDDAFDDSCHAWAASRGAPTLLVATEPAVGLSARHVEELKRWAHALGPRRP